MNYDQTMAKIEAIDAKFRELVARDFGKLDYMPDQGQPKLAFYNSCKEIEVGFYFEYPGMDKTYTVLIGPCGRGVFCSDDFVEAIKVYEDEVENYKAQQQEIIDMFEGTDWTR